MADVYDPRYEFNAPKFVDFSNIDQDADDAELEKYFDFDHENGVPVDVDIGPTETKKAKRDEHEEKPKVPLRRSVRSSSLNSPQAANGPQAKRVVRTQSTKTTPKASPNAATSSNRPRTRSMGMSKGSLHTPEASPKEQDTKKTYKAQPSNLCTSLSEWRKKTVAVSGKPVRTEKPENQPVKATKPGPMKALKSTEQLELEKIQRLRQEVAEKKMLAKRSHRRALSATRPQAVRSVQPVTKVEQFTFATDKRVDENKAPGPKENSKEFTSLLRQYQPVKAQRKPTTVNMNSSLYNRKRKVPDESAPKEEAPLWSKTPERFHSLPRNAKFVPGNKRRRSRSYCCKLTQPVTPQLETNKRSRPVHVPSAKDLEEKEIEEIQSYRFKARPFNEEIFKHTRLGVPRIPPKDTTVPTSPNFATNKRIQQHNVSREEEKQHNSFHARPVPKKILQAPQGIKEVQSQPLTDPKSPAFALKNRPRRGSNHSVSGVEEDDHIPRAHPVPSFNNVFEPRIQRSIVKVEPFSFEERNKSMLTTKQQKIQQLVHEQTKIKPFRARDPHVLHQEPFIPKPSTAPLTEVPDLQLHTERRHEERSEWETYRNEAEQRAALEKAAMEERQREEERREVENMRKQAVHHAQPIRQYRQMVIHKSKMEPTLPQSPRFSKRLRERHPNL